MGLSLIGESGGEPEVVSVRVEEYQAVPVRDLTGGAILLNQSNPTPRFLAGVVDDPLVGAMTATGHIDFSSVSNISDEFREGTVTAVDLLLRRDYVCGDTTSTLSFELRDIPGDWDARAPVDTTISTGGVITTFSIPVSQREIELPMPQAWVEANDALLRSTSFTTEFQGLALAGTSGNAILGINSTTARLRVVSAGDTVEYVPSRALTTTTSSPSQSGGLVVRDASGQGVQVTLPDSLIEYAPAAVNGIIARVPADTLLARSLLPPDFVRPMLQGLRLVGRLRANGGEFEDFFVADALLTSGTYTWPVGSIPEEFFQEVIAGTEAELILSAPAALYTANPAILKPAESSDGPVFILTLTRAGF